MWLELGDGGQPVLAPIAPGLITELTLKSWRELKIGEQRSITVAPAVLALDGEREIPIKLGEVIDIRLSQNGPHVVDVTAALRAAGRNGVFITNNKR